MCEAKWLAIFLVAVLVIILLLKSKRSTFTFSNADYQYSNPSKINEYGYYKCIFEECGDISNPRNPGTYECLEKCKYNQFHFPTDRGIRDVMCDGATTPEERWACLNNIYKKTGYDVHSDHTYGPL